MYARSTTIRALPESIDAGVDYIRDEVMPTLSAMDGCIGLSMMVDRTSGLCIATSAWQSEEDMRTSGEELQPVREQVAEMMGAGAPEVAEWEIAVLHRDHRARQGTCVRSTWVDVAPGDVGNAIDVYRMVSLPAMEELDGFCSASLLVNRTSGMAVSSVAYDSLDALERSREKAAAVRAAATREARADVVDVCEFELALAHLHVPEMA